MKDLKISHQKQIGMKLDSLARFQNAEDTTQLSKFITSKFQLLINLNRLYIFGGHDIREGSLDNLWMLDMVNFEDLDMQPED